jgi:murein peptide amidase A
MSRKNVLAAALTGMATGVLLIAVANALPEPAAIPTAPAAKEAKKETAKHERLAGDAPSRTGGRSEFLDFALAPRRPGNLLARAGVAGQSAAKRPIWLLQRGDPALEGELLVFGCIHGDECAARHLQPLAPGSGCPDPASDVYIVPNLNPDGFALGTRLNGRGVDLNRNFAAGWKPMEERGSPQFSGPKPFSEPESRLAARIVERLRPEVTVWFHQHHGKRPLVRAWGGSVTAAADFARRAKLPFRRLPWLAGTAPNWQNHRFPGTASFVVELPRGPLPDGLETRLESAIVRLARKVGED